MVFKKKCLKKYIFHLMRKGKNIHVGVGQGEKKNVTTARTSSPKVVISVMGASHLIFLNNFPTVIRLEVVGKTVVKKKTHKTKIGNFFFFSKWLSMYTQQVSNNHYSSIWEQIFQNAF